MRYFKRSAVMVAILALALTAGALAAETLIIKGKVVSVDADARTVVVKQDDGGEEVTFTVPEKRKVVTYASGKREELVSGSPVKVYGKVDPELASITDTRNVCLMPSRHDGTDKKGRLEGEYLEEGGKHFVLCKDKKVPMEVNAKWSLTKVQIADVDFVEPGMSAKYFRVKKEGENWVVSSEMRLYVKRDKIEAYLKDKNK